MGLVLCNCFRVKTSITDIFVVTKTSSLPCNRNPHNKNSKQNHDSNSLLPLDQVHPPQRTREATHSHWASFFGFWFCSCGCSVVEAIGVCTVLMVCADSVSLSKPDTIPGPLTYTTNITTSCALSEQIE